MTAALPMSGNKVTNLADGTDSTDAAAFGQIPVAATVAPVANGTGAVGTSTAWAKEDHSHPGAAIAVGSETNLGWFYAAKPAKGQLFAFSGAVAGTPMSLGVIAGITKVIGSAGWVGDGTNQYPIGASGTGFGGSTLIKLTGTTITIDIGIAGIDRGEVLLHYVK